MQWLWLFFEQKCLKITLKQWYSAIIIIIIFLSIAMKTFIVKENITVMLSVSLTH